MNRCKGKRSKSGDVTLSITGGRLIIPISEVDRCFSHVSTLQARDRLSASLLSAYRSYCWQNAIPVSLSLSDFSALLDRFAITPSSLRRLPLSHFSDIPHRNGQWGGKRAHRGSEEALPEPLPQLWEKCVSEAVSSHSLMKFSAFASQYQSITGREPPNYLADNFALAVRHSQVLQCLHNEKQQKP